MMFGSCPLSTAFILFCVCCCMLWCVERASVFAFLRLMLVVPSACAPWRLRSCMTELVDEPWFWVEALAVPTAFIVCILFWSLSWIALASSWIILLLFEAYWSFAALYAVTALFL